MADITMCRGTDCPFKDNCYRHTANASEYRQSYFVIVPYNKEKEDCEHYWKDERHKIERKK